MITRNWYMSVKSQRLQEIITGALTSPTGGKPDAGYYRAAFYTIGALPKQSVVYNPYSNGIILGSGSTPPTVDDYKLESLITSGLSSSVGQSRDDDNNPVWTITVSNTSDGDITIGEVGYQIECYTQADSASGRIPCLIERTVLDTPITIPAGGIGKIEYTIKLTIPTE